MLVIKRQDSFYPHLLRELADAPENLFCDGSTFNLEVPLISIVGAREMRPWIKEWMENELFPVLRKTKIGIVSGGARGVDQQAHWLALRAGVPNVVVLPSGLSHIYPKNLKALQGKADVCMVTEYPPETEMRKHHFYKRNRIIAGLSQLTLVLQASEKSGTMITARKALELGRSLATLPAPPLDPFFGGNNQLLFDGALMARNRHDLAQIMTSEISTFPSSSEGSAGGDSPLPLVPISAEKD